jgi:hypothetical protein
MEIQNEALTWFDTHLKLQGAPPAGRSDRP